MLGGCSTTPKDDPTPHDEIVSNEVVQEVGTLRTTDGLFRAAELPPFGDITLPATINAAGVLEAAGQKPAMPETSQYPAVAKGAETLLQGVPGSKVHLLAWQSELHALFPAIPNTTSCSLAATDVTEATPPDAPPVAAHGYIVMCGQKLPPAARTHLAGIIDKIRESASSPYQWMVAEESLALLQNRSVSWTAAPRPPTMVQVQRSGDFFDLSAAAKIGKHFPEYLPAPLKAQYSELLSQRISRPIGSDDLNARVAAESWRDLDGAPTKLQAWVNEVSARRDASGWFHAPVKSLGTVQSTYDAMRILGDGPERVMNDTTVSSLRTAVDSLPGQPSAKDALQGAQAAATLQGLGALDDARRSKVGQLAHQVWGHTDTNIDDLQTTALALAALQRAGYEVSHLTHVNLSTLKAEDPQASWALEIGKLTGRLPRDGQWRSAAAKAIRQRVSEWNTSTPMTQFWVDAHSLIGTTEMDDATMRQIYNVGRRTRGCSAFPHLFSIGGGADLCDLAVSANAVEVTGTDQARSPDQLSRTDR